MAVKSAELFRDHFLTPATATWNELRNGAESSFTRVDLTNYLWNSVICSIPIIAGGATAHMANTFLHDLLPEKLPARYLISILCTTVATVTGAVVSFVVVKLLIAGHGTLAPFDADKALKLETLHVVVMATATPIASCLNIPQILQLNAIPIFLGAPAVAGYFGTHSLYVMGFLSALYWAVNAAAKSSLPKPQKEQEAPLLVPDR